MCVCRYMYWWLLILTNWICQKYTIYIILYIHYFSEQVKLPPACAKTVHLWPSAEYQVIASDKNLEKTNKTQKKLQTPCGISSKPSDMGLQFFCFLKVLATFAQLCQKPRENKKNTTSERNWERALNREYVLYKMPLLTFTRIQLWMRNQKEIDSWKDCWNSRSKWFLWKRSIHSGNGKTYRIQYQYPS